MERHPEKSIKGLIRLHLSMTEYLMLLRGVYLLHNRQRQQHCRLGK
jgi:hypothetical protein